MKYLVAGGCGFIGSHLVEALVDRGDEVVILDNLSTGYLHNLEDVKHDVQMVKGDVRDNACLTCLLDGIDGVFHEAANVSVFKSVDAPLENNEINITGTLRLLEACRQAGVKRLVMACSCAAYGNNPILPKTEVMKPEPESPYAVSKVAGEYYLTSYARLYGLETVGLRYFNVYGPRQDPRSMYAGVISIFSKLALKGKNPIVYGDGLQSRDFVYVKDVVSANLLAMDSPDVGNGEIINIGTERGTSLLDLISALGELTDHRLTPVFEPERAGDVRHSLADISLARRVLHFSPECTIEQGLAQLLEWAKAENA